jgi:hypothetical protein
VLIAKVLAEIVKVSGLLAVLAETNESLTMAVKVAVN